jgi:hypothetical protein
MMLTTTTMAIDMTILPPTFMCGLLLRKTRRVPCSYCPIDALLLDQGHFQREVLAILPFFS